MSSEVGFRLEASEETIDKWYRFCKESSLNITHTRTALTHKHTHTHSTHTHTQHSRFARNTSSWSIHNSLKADLGLSLRSKATTYLARAAGSASHLPFVQCVCMRARACHLRYSNKSPPIRFLPTSAPGRTGCTRTYTYKTTYVVRYKRLRTV